MGFFRFQAYTPKAVKLAAQGIMMRGKMSCSMAGPLSLLYSLYSIAQLPGRLQPLLPASVAYPLPAVLFGLMAAILFFWYPLSRKRVEQLQRQKEAALKASCEQKLIEI